MRKLFPSLLFLSLLTSSCATKEKHLPRDIASLQMSNGVEGIWFVQGSSTTRGPYNGDLELRKSNDGTYNAVRVITYINSFFDGLKVQEVWTGKAVAEGNALSVSYDLSQADFITRLGTATREPSDFKNKINILERFVRSEKGLTAQFADRKVSNYTEWLTERRNLEAKPLWINERVNLDAKGPHVPAAVRTAITTFKWRIAYDHDPFIKSYKNRSEFKDENPYVIFDPTDFDFYRKNRDVIRLVNKITDDISVTEAVVKRNAYALTLEEKQKGFENNMVTNHINPQGMVAMASVDNQGHLTRFEEDGDSALWTGMYVGSQAMRYLVSREPEALENVRKSLKGLFILMDITRSNDQFARALSTFVAGQPLPPGWHQGAAPFENIMWLEGGNNDMFKGLVHGFLWASLVIPESETEIWSHLREKSRRLLDLDVVKKTSQNYNLALGLAALINKDQGLRDKYKSSYGTWSPSKLSGFSLDTSFYWHGTADWSGMNLSLVSDITGIVLADRLGETRIRDRLRERVMDMWVTYSPAQRHFVTLAAYGFAYQHGTRGDSFRDNSGEAQFQASLQRASWGLREIPYPRPNLDVQYDHSLRPEWCASPIPRMFWYAVKTGGDKPPREFFFQGLYDYPTFEKAAFDSNFLWKESAFLYKGGHAKGLEYASVDYLYAYWMARYTQVPNIN